MYACACLFIEEGGEGLGVGGMQVGWRWRRNGGDGGGVNEARGGLWREGEERGRELTKEE